MAQSPPKLRDITLPNLYRDLNLNMTFDGLLDWISASEKVTSLLMAIEAVWTWNMHRIYILEQMWSAVDISVSRLAARLTDMVEKRGWALLPTECSRDYISFCIGFWKWAQLISAPFCLSPVENSTHVIIDCEETCLEPLTFLSEVSKLTFYFKHPSVTQCNSRGQCGFILKTVPKSDSTLWTMRLCTDREDYFNEPVHFHKEIRAENMHVYFLRAFITRLDIFPISWLSWHDSAEQKNEWESKFRFDEGSRFGVLYKL